MRRLRDDFVWLVPSIVAGSIVYVYYLATNPYPAHGAGLYLTMAREVSQHGYALPRTVPYYTPGGVPFAYPPLAFYVLAAIRDVTGIGPLALSRWLPGLIVVVSLVPTYLLARELLDSRPGAALTSVLVAVNPQVIDWHVTAGGLVRAPAFLFTLVGLYAGVRLFRTGARRWLALSLSCFGLTVLTHPTYALFFVVSFLVLFAGIDRTFAGLVDGAIVGVGGVVLAAPWWLQVVSTHGVDVFLAAMGTHGGVGGGVVAELVTAPSGPLKRLSFLVLTLGALAGLATGWPFLVAWLVTVSIVFSQPRFTLFVTTFLVVAVSCTVASHLRSWNPLRPWDGHWIREGAPALVLAFAVVVSALSGIGYVRDDTAAPGSLLISATPNHVDESDLEAMAWARSATPESATFVVVGDAAEWFPLFAQRTLLVSPWGAEWHGPRSYARHTALYRTISRCGTERCFTTALARKRVRPDYVYVPKEPYTVQGAGHFRTRSLRRSLERTERYALVFENSGVAIFRVIPDRSRDRSDESSHGASSSRL